jgi:hypothetical protein
MSSKPLTTTEATNLISGRATTAKTTTAATTTTIRSNSKRQPRPVLTIPPHGIGPIAETNKNAKRKWDDSSCDGYNYDDYVLTLPPGVSCSSGRFQVHVYHGGKNLFFGTWDTPDFAAHAYLLATHALIESNKIREPTTGDVQNILNQIRMDTVLVDDSTTMKKEKSAVAASASSSKSRRQWTEQDDSIVINRTPAIAVI